MVKFGKLINKIMKRFISNIPLPFLFLLFLSSCSCKDIYYNLTEEELKLLIYKEGDIVVYKNNQNEIDTLVCNYSRTSYDSETAVGTTCSQTINNQQAGYEIISKQFKMGVGIKKLTKDKTKTSILFSLPHPTIAGGWSLIFIKEPKHAEVVPSLKINGKEYKNVYLFQGEPNTDLNKLYYDPKEGFLKFEMANGEYWEIYK
jgi:hypothetical protein